MGLSRLFGRRSNDPGDHDDPAIEVEGSHTDDLSTDEEGDDAARWLELDELEWRQDGPFDIEELEPGALDEPNPMQVDLGSLMLTGFPGMELRFQVAGEGQQIMSVLIVHEDSALEVSAFSAPRSGGFWTEVRDDIIEASLKAGGTVAHAEGPFGTELRRLLPMSTSDGKQAYQPSRMWMAEGPRWCLRGVVYGQAAVVKGTDGPIEQLLETFRGIVVRRGDQPMAPGELLPITAPEGLPTAAG